jgi:glycosyltransferase involved in cell wall biosynthesis
MDYPSFEVVVIDDASTDGTHEFLQDYRLAHPYINVVRNEQAKGLCNARNVGVANCRGDIIAFIDDDCAVSTTWIHELVKAYTRDSIAVVGGISYKGDSNDIYINDRHVWGCNMSFRSSIFQQFRFDTGLKYSHYADETDLIGRIISHGYERVVAPKAVAKHYVEDAAYRKQIPLSAYLNYHYLNAKKETWWGYYKYVLTHSLKHVAIVEYGLNFKGQSRAPLSTMLLIIRKMIYYPYVLLLEIPISAKIKHAQEERLFRLNAGHASLPR